MKKEFIIPKLHDSWMNQIGEELNKDYFIQLEHFLNSEIENHKVFPELAEIFNAYNLSSFNEVKVVVLGQDPYHGPGQAHGLAFSVGSGKKLPPSLKNIYKELQSDLGVVTSENGDLSSWAWQGVFLLNATLTVRQRQAGSHQNKGWEIFTDKTIGLLSERKENIVFLLWGNYARAKKTLIDGRKHLVLEAPHPSPFSARKGFFGCKHFSKTNQYLVDHGITPVDWSSVASTKERPKQGSLWT